MPHVKQQPVKKPFSPWVWLCLLAPVIAVSIMNVTEDLTTRVPLFRSQQPDSFNFIALRLIPKEASPKTVLIWAPANCSREAGQRATQLTTALAKAGIPSQRTNQLHYGSSLELGVVVYFLARNLFQDLEQPIVIINQRYSANPSAATVIAKYRSLP
ncbi:MAG: hypothetical protein ACAF41_05300 [Leptolyngbya sp. BL-A-14]